MSDYFDFRSALESAYRCANTKAPFEVFWEGDTLILHDKWRISPRTWKNNRGIFAPDEDERARPYPASL